MSVILWTYVPEEIEHEIADFFQHLEDKHGHIVFCLPRNRQITLKKWDLHNYFEPNESRSLGPILPQNKWLKWKDRYNLAFGEAKGLALLEKRICFAESILDYLKPDLLISWNPTCLVYGPITDIAEERNIKILYSERGLIPYGIMLDPRGVLNTSKLVSITRERIENETTKEIEELGQRAYAKLSQDLPLLIKNKNKKDTQNFDFNSGRKTILVLGTSDLQGGMYPENLSDRKAVFPYWNNYTAMVKDLLELKDVQVIFKPHPKLSIPLDLKAFDRLIICRENPNTLIRQSDIVIANGTKLELNALLLNKALILPGYGQFWNKGCAYEAHSKEQVLNLVQSIETQILPKQKDFLIKYLGRLIDQELFFFKTFEGERVDIENLVSHFNSLCSAQEVPVYEERALLLKYLRGQAIGDVNIPFKVYQRSQKWQNFKKIKSNLGGYARIFTNKFRG